MKSMNAVTAVKDSSATNVQVTQTATNVFSVSLNLQLFDHSVLFSTYYIVRLFDTEQSLPVYCGVIIIRRCPGSHCERGI